MSVCPQCKGKGTNRVQNHDVPCQYCEGTGKVNEMTHHIIAAEGYAGDLNVFRDSTQSRVYLIENPVDGKNTRVTPAMREIRFYDVVIQKEAEARLLHDLGVEKTRGRFKSFLLGLWYAALDLLKPFGLSAPARPERTKHPCLARRVKVMPIARRADLIHEDGYEEVAIVPPFVFLFILKFLGFL